MSRTRSRSTRTSSGKARIASGRGSSRLLIRPEFERLTHYLFRYPAKFHPPVARALLERYTDPDDVVLDPFCGSGTLLVEALVHGRTSVGLDVDPIAARVSRIKVHRFRTSELERSAERLRDRLARYERSADEYENRMFVNLSKRNYETQIGSLRRWVPPIPHLDHWFRGYVVVDLARIRSVIERIEVPGSHRELFRVIFASIIRNASNADPVPVSGLEVTSHMKDLEARGRLINPFALFDAALEKALDAYGQLSDDAADGASARVIEGDATRLHRHLRSSVDAVITSPPYHGAVDYYRRHQLEMFWIGATTSSQERLALLQRYVGRPRVAHRHPFVAGGTLKTDLAKAWEKRIRKVSERRADAFRHYITAMSRFFDGLAPWVRRDSPVVLVLGHSAWNDSQIPTTKLFAEIASANFDLDGVSSYRVKNRYMSYSRHNGAGIDREYVVVLRRRCNPAATPSD